MLSKSKYCAFSQCPKRLWLQTYHPELSEDNAALDARMETATRWAIWLWGCSVALRK
jgi:hypothetical protein